MKHQNDDQLRSGRLPGSELFYREVGPADADEVLVHVHGFAISGTYLMPTAEQLAPRFRSVVPDLPGFGKSPGRPGRPSFSDLADDLARVMDARGIDRATLVGNSMGCPVICEFEHRHPDRIDRAVLVSPAGGLHSRPFLRAVGQLATDALREKPSMALIAVPDYLRFGPINTAQLFAEMTRFPTIERFVQLSVPALAVLGSRDPLLPGPDRARELMPQVGPHLQVAVVLGAAHALNYSHPHELAWLIDAWTGGGEDWVRGAPAKVRKFT